MPAITHAELVNGLSVQRSKDCERHFGVPHGILAPLSFPVFPNAPNGSRQDWFPRDTCLPFRDYIYLSLPDHHLHNSTPRGWPLRLGRTFGVNSKWSELGCLWQGDTTKANDSQPYWWVLGTLPKGVELQRICSCWWTIYPARRGVWYHAGWSCYWWSSLKTVYHTGPSYLRCEICSL